MSNTSLSSSLTTASSSSVSGTTNQSSSSSTNLYPVNVMIGAPVPLAYYGFLWYGVSTGIFAKYGLNVNVLVGTGGPGNVAAVSSGKVDFSITDPGSIVLGWANSNITDVRLVSAVFNNEFYGVMYNKAIINKPSDLVGKTCATFQGNSGNNYFKLFAKEEGFNASGVNLLYASGAVFNNLILIGKASCLITTENQVADLAPSAEANNISLGFWNYADFGQVNYGNGIITSAQMIQNHPDIVKNFVIATWQSLLASSQNPQAAVQAAINVSPAINATTGVSELEFMLDTFIPNLNSTSNLLTLGWINQTKIQSTIETVTAGFGLTNVPSAADIFTNQFVLAPNNAS